MSMYVLMTMKLFQRGSSESKDSDKREAVDRDPWLQRHKRNAPGPVKRGGWQLALYQHSLSLTFVLLFLVSFALHALGGLRAYNEERLLDGESTATLAEYLKSATFWFESFQNWQSEFLVLALMVVLSIFLRQRGSPESKPVDAPHSETGGG